jgi:hypothetical protein
MISTFLLCLTLYSAEIKPIDMTCKLVTTDRQRYLSSLSSMLNDDSILTEYANDLVEVKYYQPKPSL